MTDFYLNFAGTAETETITTTPNGDVAEYIVGNADYSVAKIWDFGGKNSTWYQETSWGNSLTDQEFQISQMDDGRWIATTYEKETKSFISTEIPTVGSSFVASFQVDDEPGMLNLRVSAEEMLGLTSDGGVMAPMDDLEEEDLGGSAWGQLIGSILSGLGDVLGGIGGAATAAGKHVGLLGLAIGGVSVASGGNHGQIYGYVASGATGIAVGLAFPTAGLSLVGYGYLLLGTAAVAPIAEYYYNTLVVGAGNRNVQEA